MSQPDINSLYNWEPPPTPGRKSCRRVVPCSALSCRCLPHGVECHSRTLLQTCKFPQSMELLMSLSLTPSSLFGLEAGPVQALRACGVQPGNWWSSQETEETPVSAEMLGNKNGDWKPMGASTNGGGGPKKFQGASWGGRPLLCGAPWWLCLMSGGRQVSKESS